MNWAEALAQIRWRPQLGDPGVVGWLTVAGYAAAAILCFIAAFRSAEPGGPGAPGAARRLWLWVGLIMLFLGVNKQFDLQSLVRDVGRVLARQEGWYGQRRTVQRWFVLGVAAAGVFALAFAARKFRLAWRGHRLLLTGLAFLIVFIVIRAASFHHVDVLIQSKILGLRVNGILELGGIVLIGYGAARALRARPPG